MITRRLLLLSLLALPLPAVANSNCGCGPKANPKNRAEQMYQMALLATDRDQKIKMLRLALEVYPEHEGAKAALLELGETP